MSAKAVKLLRETALANNMTETEVVENCLARYANELGPDAEGARALLLEHVAKMVSRSKSDK